MLINYLNTVFLLPNITRSQRWRLNTASYSLPSTNKNVYFIFYLYSCNNICISWNCLRSPFNVGFEFILHVRLSCETKSVINFILKTKSSLCSLQLRPFTVPHVVLEDWPCLGKNKHKDAHLEYKHFVALLKLLRAYSEKQRLSKAENIITSCQMCWLWTLYAQVGEVSAWPTSTTRLEIFLVHWSKISMKHENRTVYQTVGFPAVETTLTDWNNFFLVRNWFLPLTYSRIKPLTWFRFILLTNFFPSSSHSFTFQVFSKIQTTFFRLRYFFSDIWQKTSFISLPR